MRRVAPSLVAACLAAGACAPAGSGTSDAAGAAESSAPDASPAADAASDAATADPCADPWDLLRASNDDERGRQVLIVFVGNDLVRDAVLE